VHAIKSAAREARDAHPHLRLSDAREIVEQAASAVHDWQERSFVERAEHLRNAAALLRDRADGYAELMAREMGKPVREGRAEIEKCAWVSEYYAENAKRFLKPQLIETDAAASYVCFAPLGVVLAIMPWNFPFWQLFRFAAPALMAGNSVVVKHSSLVPRSAAAIAAVFLEAGVPRTAYANLRLSHADTEALLELDGIAAVTFTGSTRAGRIVAACAGRALKKTVLELGGSDPYLILEDADLEAAAEACVLSRLENNGQSCVAAKRFIAVKEVRVEFQNALVRRMQARKMGDPLDSATDQGPMASAELRDHLHTQVQASIAAGATLMLGGAVPPRPGAWYPPTVLSNVGPGMPAYSEELLGPVAAIIEAEHEEDAIRIANDTSYGLGSAVFSRDRSRAERIARTRLRAGSCFVNDYVRSDPRLPFGGIKRSGHGRELSLFGIQEFVNIKTVYVR
jgi:succinate-semialdehyde dehydrogenase / glutarate-semialdehyde dehydrogenase